MYATIDYNYQGTELYYKNYLSRQLKNDIDQLRWLISLNWTDTHNTPNNLEMTMIIAPKELVGKPIESASQRIYLDWESEVLVILPTKILEVSPNSSLEKPKTN